jgi:hypothetical protein
MAKRKARTVNSFYLASVGLWTVGAIVVTQYFNSGFGVASYALVGLSLLAAIAGLFIKNHRVALSTARLELGVAAVIFVLLAIGLLWVMLSQLGFLPRLPLYSDLDFINYLMGWPAMEMVVVGSLFVAAFKVIKPTWVAYTGVVLAVVTVGFWLIALHFNLALNP